MAPLTVSVPEPPIVPPVCVSVAVEAVLLKSTSPAVTSVVPATL